MKYKKIGKQIQFSKRSFISSGMLTMSDVGRGNSSASGCPWSHYQSNTDKIHVWSLAALYMQDKQQIAFDLIVVVVLAE